MSVLHNSMRLGVLISGRGSNMVAIAEAIRRGICTAEIAVIISNNPTAAGITKAAQLNIPCVSISPKAYSTSDDYEADILKTLQHYHVDLVVLAGYMKILGPTLLSAYPNRIVNIHPSLLPSFKGLHAHQQAIDAGVRISGCTVHFVDRSLDGGPIILQAAVPVYPDDTADTLSERILAHEHQLYPQAIQLIVENRLRIQGKKVTIVGNHTDVVVGHIDAIKESTHVSAD